MSLNFYLGEVTAQSAAAKQMANEYMQFCGTLKDSVNAFMNAPLSGKTYDSAKLYFSTVYPTLASGFILACEALIEAHSKFPEEFQSQVDTCDVIEDQLKVEIAQGQALLQSMARTMDKEKEPNQRLEQRYMGVQSSIQKNEEKLQRLYEFNASSPGLFADFEAQLANLDAGLAEVEKGAAWNSGLGTFDLGRMNMAWTKPIGRAWDKRQKKIDQIRNAEMQRELGKLDGYEIVCINSGRTKTWTLKKNGEWIYPGDEPELHEILNRYKNYLKKDQYTVTQPKIVRNIAPLAIPGGPALENLIKAGKITAGASAAIVVGKGIVDKIKNAPSIQSSSRIKSVEENDELPSQGQVDGGVAGGNPVAVGKQGKHVLGHKNNKQAKEQGEEKTTWREGTNGVAETQKGWLEGDELKNRHGEVKEYDTGKVVGSQGETKIRVHIDKHGNIHGYPVKK
ncbi:T7SS effector LXG polymorphic toxin [Enterococcus wangshanyuanii]|uniref:LXG domain-containing protein n=1 Tax=Enterococcus wangshanyuanii TaxID=2005703 RepID=A0ABQ1NMD9_9ENTE|nr:hypothetical protein [Enterococcus wangshanyuanii]GGC77916.1 hypothetical protein GCM10011573_04440 [Enterococcus wangshanyuanii]